MRARALAFAPILLLLACADPTIEATTQLENTIDTTGPYRVDAVVYGSHANDKIEVFYNASDRDPNRYIPLLMNPLDADGRAADLYSGQMPGQRAGTTVRYYVAVTRDGERVAEDPVGGDLRPFLFTIEQ